MADQLHLHSLLLHRRAEPGDFVQADLGALADQLRRCNERRNRRDGLRHGLLGGLAFLRRHLFTVLVLLLLLAAARSLAA